MAKIRLFLASLLLLAFAGWAQADNRVAAHTHAPHVTAAGVGAMTTPGQCGPGYTPAMNKGKRACVSCPAGYKYTLYNTIETCVACDPGYDYYGNANPAICAGCPAGYAYNPSIGACFPKP